MLPPIRTYAKESGKSFDLYIIIILPTITTIMAQLKSKSNIAWSLLGWLLKETGFLPPLFGGNIIITNIQCIQKSGACSVCVFGVGKENHSFYAN